MKQRFPSFFKMKTERVKEARSIRRGIRALWGTRMTHNQTKSSTVCVCVFVNSHGADFCWQGCRKTKDDGPEH